MFDRDDWPPAAKALAAIVLLGLGALLWSVLASTIFLAGTRLMTADTVPLFQFWTYQGYYGFGQARGVVRKMPKAAIAGMERRGVDPRVRQRERQAAEHEARAPKPAQPRDWSRDIQARQDSIRRAYLDHANALERGDAADRRLARDIRRFVADMPVALTRRQALAVELRRVLDQRHGKAVPVGVSSDPTPPDKGWYRASPAFALGPAKWPRR